MVRTPAQVREVFERAMRETRSAEKALAAVYDAGRMDAAKIEEEPTRPAAMSILKLEKAARGVALVRRADRYRMVLGRFRGFTPEEILSRDPSAAVSQVRHELVWILRTFEKLSYPDIAMATGREDHTTALYAFRKVERQIALRPEFRRELMEIVEVASRGERLAA